MEQDKNLTAEIQQEETLEGAIPLVTFDEFTPPSYEEWKQEVVTALKGGSFEKLVFDHFIGFGRSFSITLLSNSPYFMDITSCISTAQVAFHAVYGTR